MEVKKIVRTDTITIPVSNEEKEIIQKNAELNGMTMSAFIRYVILNKIRNGSV